MSELGRISFPGHPELGQIIIQTVKPASRIQKTVRISTANGVVLRQVTVGHYPQGFIKLLNIPSS